MSICVRMTTAGKPATRNSMSRRRSLRMSIEVSTEARETETFATPVPVTVAERLGNTWDSAVSPFSVVTKPKGCLVALPSARAAAIGESVIQDAGSHRGPFP